jgi:hypothetical protein
MALFDKMSGKDAGVVDRPDTQQQFDELKRKYQPVLRVIEQQHVRVQNLHVENNKLLIRGVAPSQDAKNKVWDQIKLIDPTFGDLIADITAEQGKRQTAKPDQTYTVKAGDTLSKIGKQYYGDANEYMRIFNANRDKLSDPDKIQVGQKLVIPPQN